MSGDAGEAGCPASAALEAFARGSLPRSAFDGIADHLEQCLACQAALVAFDGLADPLVATLRHDAEGAWPRLGRFELLEELGRGSFGRVIRAYDTELRRGVALKLLRSDRIGPGEELERLLREARSVAQLKHPGIVTLHEVGRSEDGTGYLVQELVEGKTLADLVRAGPMDPHQAAALAAEIAEALDHAHGHGIIHRDVKPSNVIVDRAGHPHITDFGLAKQEADEGGITREGDVLGTPEYMSPEQARGETGQVGAHSDIYSLGVILYELLLGERPFRGNRRMLILQVLQDPPRPPRQLREDIPRDLETICLKAMAKGPGQRYATALDLAADLRRFLRGEPVRARRASWPERTRSWARRRPAAAALAAVGLVGSSMLVAVLVVSNRRISGEQRHTRAALAQARRSNLELEAALLRNARLTAEAISAFNSFYASQVVGRLKERGIEVTHDYLTRKNAIPLPATMSVELARQISARSGMEVRLYSDFPFPWRVREGGPRDDFEREALRQLRARPDQPFARFMLHGGRRSLRYSIASRMEQSCLDCHNHRPDSPKRDWKAGDVRGVYEVIFPVDTAMPPSL
jgi:hypothetical protein